MTWGNHSLRIVLHRTVLSQDAMSRKVLGRKLQISNACTSLGTAEYALQVDVNNTNIMLESILSNATTHDNGMSTEHLWGFEIRKQSQEEILHMPENYLKSNSSASKNHLKSKLPHHHGHNCVISLQSV